jgi:hypothetical protein
LAAKHRLTDHEFRVFRRFHLELADRQTVCREFGLGNSASEFFSKVYRIEAKLGRIFATLQPYSLLPWEYFTPGTGRWKPKPAHQEVHRPCGPRCWPNPRRNSTVKRAPVPVAAQQPAVVTVEAPQAPQPGVAHPCGYAAHYSVDAVSRFSGRYHGPPGRCAGHPPLV